VEDELLHAGLVRSELKKAGYDSRDLVHVISGERGLEILQKKAFDLVLFDFPLPGMDVMDLLNKMRGMNLDIPVFMITGQQSVKAAMKAMELGPYDYMSKSDLVTPKQAAAMLGVTYQTIQNYIHTEKLKSYKTPGGRHRIPREDIMNLGFLDETPTRSELYRSYVETLGALTDALDARNGIASGHSKRVAAYVAPLTEQMGLSGEEQESIKLAALLHDVGKIFISETVLSKPGKLTEQEQFLIRQHPEIGERIVGGVEFLRATKTFIRHHHERFDGGGYPDGLSYEEIPLGARIISVAEVFDCITSDCAYRPKREIGEAIDEIERCAGAQFDSEIVSIFLENRENVVRGNYSNPHQEGRSEGY
ncbi:MAG: HD domain-containing phosphohydrolase, partial [Thermodesulfobacteriota bacterium]